MNTRSNRLGRRLIKCAVIVAAAFALYCLTGFLIVPLLARVQIEKRVSRHLRGSLTIEHVTVNPLRLSTSFKNVTLKDSGGRKVLSVGEITTGLWIRKVLSKWIGAQLFQLTDFELLDPAVQAQIVKLPYLLLNGIHYHWSNNVMEVESVVAAGGEVKLIAAEDGRLNIPAVIEGVTGASPGAEAVHSNAPASPAKPFKLHVHALTLSDYAFSLENRRGVSSGLWELERINVDVKQFRLEKEHRSSVAISLAGKRGGRIGIQGDFSVLPPAVTLKASIDEVPLKLFNPPLKGANLHFDRGSLTSALDLRLALDDGIDWSVSGDVAVNHPSLLMEDLPQPLFAADEVALRSASVKSLPFQVSAAELSFTKPAVFYQLKAGRSDNSEQTTEKSRGKGTTPEVSVASVRLEEGAVFIVDTLASPPTQLEASNLVAQIKNFSSGGVEPVQVNSQGQILGDGALKLEASYVPERFPANLDAVLKIDRMPLAGLSPYAARFLGRMIAEGRLSADLSAKAAQGALQASNKIVLHHFSLGKVAPGKDVVDLPLGTVLALLRDSNGNITLDVPMTGNTTDPSFHYMAQLGRTLRDNLIHIAAAPLTMLSSLYNWHGGSLQQVAFNLSSATLPDDEVQKLRVLAKAMLDRPALELKIHGASSPAELGGKASFEELSDLADNRAKQIKRVLEAKGVPPGRLFLSQAAVDKNMVNNRVASELKLIFGD